MPKVDREILETHRKAAQRRLSDVRISWTRGAITGWHRRHIISEQRKYHAMWAPRALLNTSQRISPSITDWTTLISTKGCPDWSVRYARTGTCFSPASRSVLTPKRDQRERERAPWVTFKKAERPHALTDPLVPGRDVSVRTTRSDGCRIHTSAHQSRVVLNLGDPQLRGRPFGSKQAQTLLSLHRTIITTDTHTCAPVLNALQRIKGVLSVANCSGENIRAIHYCGSLCSSSWTSQEQL